MRKRTEIEKYNVSEMVKQIRKNMGAQDDEDREAVYKQDYNHFEKHTDEQKKQFMKKLLPVTPHNTIK